MNKAKANISVIMPIYAGTKIDHAKEALQSIENQTLKPHELVIVIDGPIQLELYRAVFFLKNHSQLDIKIVKYSTNKGVGFARDLGVKKASGDYIALMDSDDFSHPNRLERQLSIINAGYDVVGSWIAEYDDELKVRNGTRRVPSRDTEIKRYSRFRSPVNNVTAMFRKKAYMEVGGYKNLRYLEDYDLYARMILKDFKFFNLEEILVDVRAGTGQISRRGHKILKTEISVMINFYRIGFYGLFDLSINLAIRTVLRLSPNFLRAFMYWLTRKY